MHYSAATTVVGLIQLAKMAEENFQVFKNGLLFHNCISVKLSQVYSKYGLEKA